MNMLENKINLIILGIVARGRPSSAYELFYIFKQKKVC